MNINRLKILAVHLHTVKPSNFNLEEWTCGTQACAVGHACSISAFKELGFSLYMVGIREVSGGIPSPIQAPHYDGETGWDAVERFFGINYQTARMLFGEEHYPHGAGPRAVAARIHENILLWQEDNS